MDLIKKDGFITERLILRKWTFDDKDTMYNLCKDEEVSLPCGFPPHKSLEDSKTIIEHFMMSKHPYVYAMCLKDENVVIGCIEIKFQTDLVGTTNSGELGFWLGKAYWGNGYMKEAADALIDFAFSSLKLDTIWCAYYEGNQKSKRVQEKIGFKFHHQTPNIYLKQLDEYRTSNVNIMTKEDWINLRKKK